MKKKLSIIDITIPIILLMILLLTKISANFAVIVILTLFIGWVIPFIINILTGIIIIKDTHHRLGFIANLLNIILSLILIYLVIRLIDKKTIVFLIEYLIILIISILNVIYLKKRLSSEHTEKDEIKEQKKKNNGAIV